MKNLYFSNIRRMSRSLIYLAGLAIALVVTFFFTAGKIRIADMILRMTAAERMCFVSIAIIVFYTVYIPLLICNEYGDGVMRNRLIAGYSQKQIFFSGLLAQLSSVLLMWLVHLIGGFAAGAAPLAGDWGHMFIMLAAMAGYISLVYTLSFRLVKPVRSVIFCYLLLNLCVNGFLIGNFAVMTAADTAARPIVAIIYNINVVGQWAVSLGIVDPEAGPGVLPQLLISLCIILLSAGCGSMGLNKRDMA
ncbi:MAG: hypothetical protein IK115_10560 [Lachnospiraceae bacterium]|nr:hypothetical protein [Lachnospiraceae bacterium]